MVELKLRSDTMDRHQAEEAVRTILNYIEKTNRKDPPREGLEQTPERVISMFDEIFSGYQQDPSEILDSTFNGKGTMASYF